MGTGIRTSLPMVARRRARRRLVARPDPPGHRRHQVRLAEHRRLVLDQGLLRRHARRRRQRADDARAGGRGALERAGGVRRGPQSRRRPWRRETIAVVRRARRGGVGTALCPIPSRCASSRPRNTRSSARPSPSRTSTISSRARARSASTHGCREWSTRQWHARRCSAAGRRRSTMRRRGRSAACRTSSASPRRSHRTCSRRSAAPRSSPTTAGRRCRAARR